MGLSAAQGAPVQERWRLVSDQTPKQRLRITFAKERSLKYISHLDLSRTWERVFRRAGLPLAYSQGFNPRPRFQIAAALPVGVTGQAELLDAWLLEGLAPTQTLSRLHDTVPEGLRVRDVQEVDLRAPSLQSLMREATYRAVIQSQEPVEAVRTRVQALLDAPTVLRRRQHKGKEQVYDLGPLIHSLEVKGGDAHERIMTMRLQASPQGAGRPDEVLDALGLSLAPHSIERTNLIFEFDK